MPTKQQSKGRKYEREFAKFMSDSYGESFIKSNRDSGSYIGGKNVRRMDTLSEGQILASRGDIQAPDGWKHFNVECKNGYNDFQFHYLPLNKDIKLLDEWIVQVLEANREGDLNLIVFNCTYKGKYVFFESKLTNHFVLKKKIVYKQWVMTDFDDFFSENKNKIKYLSNYGIVPKKPQIPRINEF